MFKDILIVQQMVELIDTIILYSGDFDSVESFVRDSKSYDATLMPSSFSFDPDSLFF